MKKIREVKDDIKKKWDEDGSFKGAVVSLSAGAVVFTLLILAASKDNKKYLAALQTYSFGKESPLKIKATPSEASAYNRFTKWLLESERSIHEPENWMNLDPTWMHIQGSDKETWNRLGLRINEAVETLGLEDASAEIFSKYLVKN